MLAEFNAVAIIGTKSRATLPVRTTFLHFFYPAVVPIFDKMVLQAVGMWSEGANTRVDVLRDYLAVALDLASAYESKFRWLEETPLRLVDMALWVVRNDLA